MITPTLPDQLRTLVDQVDVPTLAEVRAHAARPPRTRAPLIRVAGALAAVLVLVAAGIGTVALLDDDSTTSPATDRTTVVPPECIVTQDVGPGCEMPAEDAAALLGFSVHEPSGLPEGWVPLAARLRVYPDPFPGTDKVTIYVRAWGPPGTDIDALADCAKYVVIRERDAVPGEDPSQNGAPFALGNGTTAYGQDPFDGCGSEPSGYYGELAWIHDGRSTVVAGDGVTLDQLLTIARSVDR